MVSRGSVDIATLTLIYVMLGLGLNVVVGLSGLLVLGYAGFYAIGAYTYGLMNHYFGWGSGRVCRWPVLPRRCRAAARLPSAAAARGLRRL